jgi:hypothetical protein
VTGFEPATSRLSGEVSQIFTTGKTLCPQQPRVQDFCCGLGRPQKRLNYRGTSDQSAFPLLWLSYGIAMPAGFHTCVHGVDEVTLIFTTGNLTSQL